MTDTKHHPIFGVDQHPPLPRVGPSPDGIPWPSFTGLPVLVGHSPSGRTTVYYDSSLGAPALANAQALVADADRVTALNNSYFGKTGGAVNVIVFALSGATDGTGGADHMGCDFATGNNIEVCAAYGNNILVSALFEAELSECMMNGQLCGYSNGEALSRWCAMAVSPPGTLDDFASAPTWQQNGCRDWINHTEATDQDADSIGCGMAFLSWMFGKRGHTLRHLAQMMVKAGDGGTLAEVAGMLDENVSTVWKRFKADVNLVRGGIQNDDPFNGLRKVQS